VKFKHGNQPVRCSPGIHWYWPWTTTFESYPTARQADRLQAQTIVTTDDRVIAVSGVVVYRVDDVMPLLTENYQASTTIKDICLTAVHEVVCKMTWEELKTEQRKGTLDTKLKNAAKDALFEYGVRVIKLMLIDLAPCRVLKLIQSTSTEEN
jgi:regulator of protease activity HflC (stomatin/prohibitin superfamily)